MTPAQQVRWLRDEAQRRLGGEAGRVELAPDLYWLFIRRAGLWEEIKRAKDVGKWILVLPAIETTVLELAAMVLPLVGDGAARLVKFTNLSTPRGADKRGTAVILAYCPATEKDALGRLLEPLWGPKIFWKTNRQTFAEAADR